MTEPVTLPIATERAFVNHLADLALERLAGQRTIGRRQLLRHGRPRLLKRIGAEIAITWPELADDAEAQQRAIDDLIAALDNPDPAPRGDGLPAGGSLEVLQVQFAALVERMNETERRTTAAVEDIASATVALLDVYGNGQAPSIAQLEQHRQAVAAIAAGEGKPV